MAEAAQSLMRLGLGQPMQIERGVDRAAPARQLALEPPFDRGERRRGGLRRSVGRRLGRDRGRGRGRAAQRDSMALAASLRAPARRGARFPSRARSPRRSGAANACGTAAAPPSRLVPLRQKHDQVSLMARCRRARPPPRRCQEQVGGPVPQSPSRCPGRSSAGGTVRASHLPRQFGVDPERQTVGPNRPVEAIERSGVSGTPARRSDRVGHRNHR